MWTWSHLSPPPCQCGAICDCPEAPHGLTEPLLVPNVLDEKIKRIITVAWGRQSKRQRDSTDFLSSPPRLLWTALAPRGSWQLLPVLPFDWWGPSQMFPSPNQWEFKCFVHVNTRQNITGSGPRRSLAASLLISPPNVSEAPHESGPTQRQPIEMEGSHSFASSSISCTCCCWICVCVFSARDFQMSFCLTQVSYFWNY